MFGAIWVKSPFIGCSSVCALLLPYLCLSAALTNLMRHPWWSHCGDAISNMIADLNILSGLSQESLQTISATRPLVACLSEPPYDDMTPAIFSLISVPRFHALACPRIYEEAYSDSHFSNLQRLQ